MHEGHRARMRERITNEGIDNLHPHEVLEYMLYYVIPRKDTNEIAHELINKFGSLAKILSADIDDLTSVKGITPNVAHFLTSLPLIFKTYSRDLVMEKQKIVTRKDVVNFLAPVYKGDKEESFFVLCLDARNNIIKLEKINSGAPSEVVVDARKLVEIAIKNKAASVIISHNHPSGNTSPSKDDIDITRSITVALELVKVKMLDHFIFSDLGYYSFAEDGLVNVISRDVNKFLKEGLKY